MKMSRPKTKELRNLRNRPPGWVLKREFSKTGHDVYVPKLPVVSNETEAKDAAAFLKKRKAQDKDGCLWLTQELAPFLSVAEFRFMCINRVPIRESVTGRHPNDHPQEPGELWCYETNEWLRPLSDLQ